MDSAGVFRFILSKRYAVVATVHPTGEPEAALVGFAFDDDVGMVFDTSGTSRKARNLRTRPAVAVVVGWDEETTVQMEGLAQEPSGLARERAKAVYFQTWPDGRDREAWPDIAYFVIRPRWIRYSRYSQPACVVEFDVSC